MRWSFFSTTGRCVQRKNGDDLHVMWRVPFEAGELRAVSRRGGKRVLEKTIKTAGKAFRLELIPTGRLSMPTARIFLYNHPYFG